MKHSTKFFILVLLTGFVFGSLFYNKNRNETDLRDNPADRKSEVYQGYESFTPVQTVTVLNAYQLSNGFTHVVQLSNSGWQPAEFQVTHSGEASGAWSPLQPDRKFEIELPEIPGVYDLTCLFRLPDDSIETALCSVIYDAVSYDTNAPTAGSSGNCSLFNRDFESISLSWVSAADDIWGADDIFYRVYYSTSDNISTVTDATNNGTAANNWTAHISSYTITSLTEGTPYWIKVLVRDSSWNIGVYSTFATATWAANRIFYTDGSDLRRCRLNGSSDEALVTTGSPTAIALDTNQYRMFWCDRSGDAVYAADMDGAGATNIISGFDQPRGIAFDHREQKLYISSSQSNAVFRCNPDGSTMQYVFGTGTSADNLRIDENAQKIYWLRTGTEIRRANMDGTGSERFCYVGSSTENFSLDYSAGRVYYGVSGDTFMFPNPMPELTYHLISNPSSGTTIDYTDPQTYGGIAIDPVNSKIYYQTMDGLISSDLEGGSDSTLISSITPSDIVVYIVP